MKDNQSLKKLEGYELAGITFIRDYIQFLFDGPFIDGYVWPIINIDSKTLNLNSIGYRDALCRQIGKTVKNVILEKEKLLKISFFDDTEIEFSLKDEDKTSPDSVLVSLEGDTWVW